MSTSQWHKFYAAEAAAPPGVLFDLLSDLPQYDRWLSPSERFSRTTDVEPYPVQRGSRYHDGKPDEPGKDWWGTVTGFQRPGSLDFHHTIFVRQLRATVDVHIHYAFESNGEGTLVQRWLILDFRMPWIFRPLRGLIISKFDEENVRTMAAVKQYADALPRAGAPDPTAHPPPDRLADATPLRVPWRRWAIVGVKLVHSAIFLVNSAAILHLFEAGLRDHPSRWTRPALAVALTESAVFVANRGRCPLTGLAEGLGAASGRVSDIFLPGWFADRIPRICTPPLLVGVLALAFNSWRRAGRPNLLRRVAHRGA
jgi:hypothetical protein